MEDCLSLPGLRWEDSISLRTDEYEAIYTYNDKYMRWFIRQSIKGDRVRGFNQYYESKICDSVLKMLSEEIDVKGFIFDNTEAYLYYKNKHLESFEKENESKFNEYRIIDVDEMQNYINSQKSDLPVHQLLKQIKLIDLLREFDAVSSYPSAMWDKSQSED